MKFAPLFALLLLLVSSVACAQNLLVNPSFETGNFSGWTMTGAGAIGTDGLVHSPNNEIVRALTGNFALYNSGTSSSTITQAVPVEPGQSYVAGFYAAEGKLTLSGPGIADSFIFGGVTYPLDIGIIPQSITRQFMQMRQIFTAPPVTISTTLSFVTAPYVASYDDFFFQPFTPASYSSGQTTRLLIQGDPVPDHPGAVFGGGVIVPFINKGGATVEFVSSTLGNAIVITDGKSTNAAVINGQPAPEGNGSLTPASVLAVNNKGQFAFDASLNNTAGGTADNEGVYLYDGVNIVNLARKGTPVPDGNGKFFQTSAGSLNDQGKVLIAATLAGTTGGSADNQAIFLHDGAQLIKLARTGDLTPSGTDKFNTMGLGAINATGQVAFWARTVPQNGGNGTGAVFFYDNGGVSEVARSGQTADNQSWSCVTSFGQVELTDSGKVIFDAKIGATSGILLRDNNTFKVLAQVNKPAPDGNGTFSEFYESLTASDSGQVAITATLKGTAGGFNDYEGIYRAGPEGIIKIARAGQATPEKDGNFFAFDPNPSISSNGIVSFISQNSNAANDSEVGIYVGDGRDTLLVSRFGYSVDGAITDENSSLNRDSVSVNSNGQVAYRIQMSDGKTHVLSWTPTLHWRSTVSGDWTNSDNWTLGLTPAAPHPVVIDPALPISIAAPAGVTTIQSLEISGTAQARLALASSSNLTVTGDAKLNSTATLAVNLAGTQSDADNRQYSRLSIGGQATFGGTLEIVKAADFTPKLGDTFDIISYNDHLGRFDAISGIHAGDHLSFAAIYLADRLQIVAALPGDANLDQSVGFADLVAVAQHYGTSNQDWSTGDFTGDGIVDFQDLVTVAQNYGTGTPIPAIPGATPEFNRDWAAASVPEPSVLAIAFSAILFLSMRRRR